MRSERLAVGMLEPEGLGPLERVQVGAPRGVAGAEVDDLALGVGHDHALAELREDGREEPALLLEGVLQRLLLAMSRIASIACVISPPFSR